MFWKKKKEPQYLIRDDIKRLTKYVLTISDGNQDIDFYEFETMYDMPAKRFAHFNDFLEDYHRGMSNEDLIFNLKEAIKEIESNEISGITNANIRLKWMRARSEISNDSDLIMKVLSCALFTRQENLLDYDYDLAEWKIKLFDRRGS